MTRASLLSWYFAFLLLWITPRIGRADFVGPVMPSEGITADWRSFELEGDLGFDSAGNSVGPKLAFVPQILGVLHSPNFRLAPRFDFSLFKSPGGVDPMLGLGVEGWWLFNEHFYVAPGVGAAAAFEAGSAKAFPAVSATFGYFLPAQPSGGLASYLDRVFVNYELYLATLTTQEISLGIGIHWEGGK